MPQIRIKNGPQKGKTTPLDGTKPIIIGRDPTATLQVIDKGASREHAEVFRVGEMVFIRDLGSRNGTFVNEEQVEEELLREGDVLRLGSTQLVFESAKSLAEPGGLQYEESEDFRTSLELKVEDLFAGEGVSQGREGEHFLAICQATQLLNSERDEKKLFERLMDLIQEYIPADHLYLFLQDEASGAIAPRAMRQKSDTSEVPISRTILKRVITESRSILTADAMQDERFKTGESIVLNQIRSVLCTPIHSGAQAIGAIYAVNARLAETFDQADLKLLTSIGTQLGATLGNLDQTRGRRKMFLELIEELAALLEKEGPGPGGHARRVRRYAEAVARELNLSDREILYLNLAALLHDIGAVKGVSGLQDDAARLDGAGEAGRLKRSVVFLERIGGMSDVLSDIEGLIHTLNKADAPKEAAGGAIPAGGRILSVANAFDHLLYDAKKSAAEPPEAAAVRKAFTELGNQAGEIYDIKTVRALTVAYRHGHLFPALPKMGNAEETSTDADAVVEPAETPAEGKRPPLHAANADQARPLPGR